MLWNFWIIIHFCIFQLMNIWFNLAGSSKLILLLVIFVVITIISLSKNEQLWKWIFHNSNNVLDFDYCYFWQLPYFITDILQLNVYQYNCLERVYFCNWMPSLVLFQLLYFCSDNNYYFQMLRLRNLEHIYYSKNNKAELIHLICLKRREILLKGIKTFSWNFSFS